MKKIIVFLLFLYGQLLSQSRVNEGLWRGVLMLDAKKQIELPFIFNVFYAENDISLTIFNGEEKIVIDEAETRGDSLLFKMPVFDTEFKVKFFPGLMQGVWINHSKKENNVIPFSAVFGQTQRFKSTVVMRSDFSGRWETTFSPGLADSSKAIGVFKQTKQIVSGTFLTETGDYRYLEGIADGKYLYLSCFDGAHAYLFTALMDDKGQVHGDFYAGAAWHEKFTCMRNDKFALRDPYSITGSVKGVPVDFSFTDTDGKKVSLSDERYKNKAVIVQLMGSWCPNCMDEPAYLSSLYNEYKDKGLEIIALAYERSGDFEKARRTVERLKNKYGAGYEFLVTLQSGNIAAQKSLPFLDKVAAFPTTLYLNKQHGIEKIYTGYNGPATGEAYFKMKEGIRNLINELIK